MSHRSVRTRHLLLFHCSDTKGRLSSSAGCSGERAPNSIRDHHHQKVHWLLGKSFKNPIFSGRQKMSNFIMKRSKEVYYYSKCSTYHIKYINPWQDLSADPWNKCSIGYYSNARAFKGTSVPGDCGLQLWDVFDQPTQKNIWHRSCALLYSVLVYTVYLSKRIKQN